MSPWRTKPKWAKGTYMRLKSPDDLKAFVITHDDMQAHRAGKPVEMKMTQRGLADRIGVHPSFINHLTSGRRKVCEPETAERICEVLGVPMKLLFIPTEPTNKGQYAHRQLKRPA